MNKYLIPKQILNRIQDIDFAKLKTLGIKFLLLDIDETLIPRGVNDVSPQVFDWITNRKDEGFKLCLTSNSKHPLRVKYIGQTLGVPAISMGFKPFPFAFWRALKKLNAKPQETAMIGDQLFMDTLGANLLGIYSIHVKPMNPETFFLRIWMRQIEDWVLGQIKQ